MARIISRALLEFLQIKSTTYHSVFLRIATELYHLKLDRGAFERVRTGASQEFYGQPDKYPCAAYGDADRRAFYALVDGMILERRGDSLHEKIITQLIAWAGLQFISAIELCGCSIDVVSLVSEGAMKIGQPIWISEGLYEHIKLTPDELENLAAKPDKLVANLERICRKEIQDPLGTAAEIEQLRAARDQLRNSRPYVRPGALVGKTFRYVKAQEPAREYTVLDVSRSAHTGRVSYEIQFDNEDLPVLLTKERFDIMLGSSQEIEIVADLSRAN